MTDISAFRAFPVAIRIGDTVYVGASTAPATGDIEAQTARSFETLVARLEQAGARMSDLVNLRTYYVYSGAEGRDVTEYWERMTAVRLRYLADPGPAATALRVLGVPHTCLLIGVDGIAALNPDRQRIMPAHAWDWTLPVPLSQGWRVGDKIYVGGQISADRSGRTIAIDDVAAQTRHALEYIRHVLLDGGQSWSNVVSLRVCFKHDGDAIAAATRLATILGVVREAITAPRPALTALGVNLLYEGLLLEIDAVSRAGGKRAVTSPGAGDAKAISGFPTACVAGDELYIGGLFAEAGAALETQVECTLRRLLCVMSDSGFEPAELVKLTLFLVPVGRDDQLAADRVSILELVRRYLPYSQPVVTFLALPGLPHDGQRFQLDGVAVHTSDRMAFSLSEG
jgi:enamine deaminase RidA (YjgF/YER057c/UK114 family)